MMWQRIKFYAVMLAGILAVQQIIAAGYPDKVAPALPKQQVKQYSYDCNWAYNTHLEKQLLKLKKYQVTNILEPYAVRLIIPNYVLFNPGQTNLIPTAAEPLNIIANIIHTYPGAKITIHAYTDDVVRADDGQTLTDKHAQQVAGFFWLQNIPDQTQSLTYNGKDSVDPIANNQSIDGITANRRVEIVMSLPH